MEAERIRLADEARADDEKIRPMQLAAQLLAMHCRSLGRPLKRNQNSMPTPFAIFTTRSRASFAA